MQSDVSIIITCHPDVEPFVMECLESIKGQVTQPKEIILIVDNYKRPVTFPGVTTILRDFTMGVARSREQGFKLSTGKYILFVDGDDVLPENFLSESLKHIEKYDVVYPSILTWSCWGSKPLENGWHTPAKTVLFKNIIKKNEVVVTSLMKRKVFEKVGGFDHTLSLFEDWDFILKAYTQGFTFIRSEAFLKYRQRRDSRNRQEGEIRAQTCQKIRNRYLAYTKKRV